MQKLLTAGFYKFLLGFSVIIFLSFGMLVFLGLQDSQVLPEDLPANVEE